MQIRALDPVIDTALLDRVAQGMRATLVEVEGEAAGSSLYDMDWLRQRALQHALAVDWPAVVLLAEREGELLGHSLLREDPPGEGLISTTYVWPVARRQGLARALLKAGEAWFQALGVGTACTWTSATNRPLIQLYETQGYRRVADHVHDVTGTLMIQLCRSWA